jgi:lauroyl/myristoyl acyltransferase
MLLASHYASWEWLITLNQKIGYHGVGVYKKLSNKYFDKLLEIFDQNTTLSWLTPAKRFPSPEIKTRDSFHLWSTQRSTQRQIGFFIGPLWYRSSSIPALKCWQKI